MKNIKPQPIARQNNCRNATSAVIAHQAEWTTTASHGNLNFTVVWFGFSAEVRHKQKPRPLPRSGFSLFSASGSYFNKPPLRCGDDAANQPACVQKNAELNAC
jgi:hypothetical protein